MARKHAGDQAKGWICRVSVLHEKSGSESPLKQFNYLLKRIVEANDLPEYEMTYVNTADNASAVHFVRRGAAERAQLKANLAHESAEAERRRREDLRTTEVDAMMAKRRVAHSGD
jgi:hypothetical protein